MSAHRLTFGTLLSTTAAAGMAAFPLSQVVAQERKPAVQSAIERLATSEGVPVDRLQLLHTARQTVGGKRMVSIKALDPQTGRVFAIETDAAGNPVDPQALDEDAAGGNRKIHPALIQTMRGEGPQRRQRVIVWTAESPAAVEAMADRNEKARLERELQQGEATVGLPASALAPVNARRAAIVESAVAPVKRAVKRLDPQVRGDRYAPGLYASLTPAQIEAVSALPGVAAVYLDDVNRPELEVALPTTNTTTVHTRGFTGTGVRVGVIEVGGRVATANPFLANVVQDTTNVCATASAHSTGVAGIIASTSTTRRGVAPGATVRAAGSCGGVTSQLQARSTAAVDWGARVLNLSWGSNIGLVPGANDRFYDELVINRFVTVVKSAGNEGGTCGAGNGNVTSPGLAYNVLTVGNFDDRNTVSWTGDVMNPCSSWRDPTSLRGDREKPEVAGPGTNINSTTRTSPWTGAIGSGTSYAAPMYSGLAALMMQRNTALRIWPEGVRAIAMVSSIHNIEGATRLSEFDGTGGMVAHRADDIAALRTTSGSRGWNARSYDCTAALNTNVATMALTAGVRTRVAIAWAQNPSYLLYASGPSADLDLHVINPSGSLVASSSSFDNTYEIVDFTPSVSGTYTLRIRKFRCDLTPRWLGYAWRVGS
jgi:hypothetical protein